VNAHPTIAAQNLAHCRLMNTEQLPDLSLKHAGSTQVVNVLYVLLGEFGVVVLLTESTAILRGHIGEIVGIRAQEQVPRIAAWAIIAAMQNGEAVRYRPDEVLVADPVNARAKQ
jgi:hypothetical protein